MNEISIPWKEIGAFGGFTIVVLALVLWFVLKLRKPKNTPGGTINKARCINNPRFQTSLTNIEMTKESVAEMKGDMKTLREKSIEQTNALNNIYNEAKDQTELLQKICNKIGRK